MSEPARKRRRSFSENHYTMSAMLIRGGVSNERVGGILSRPRANTTLQRRLERSRSTSATRPTSTRTSDERRPRSPQPRVSTSASFASLNGSHASRRRADSREERQEASAVIAKRTSSRGTATRNDESTRLDTRADANPVETGAGREKMSCGSLSAIPFQEVGSSNAETRSPRIAKPAPHTHGAEGPQPSTAIEFGGSGHINLEILSTAVTYDADDFDLVIRTPQSHVTLWDGFGKSVRSPGAPCPA